ncbi:MAG: hypothetical protein JOZ09_06000 [Pseudonocardiales bacterium]|nr:hypothetical protein [Pseudonocardiales bacterium]
MKTPRIDDFDPEAAERKLGSPLDGMPAIQKPQPPPQQLVEPPAATDAEQKTPYVSKTTRHYAPRTFNIYQDQIEYLTKASLEQRLAGRDVSINDMVREAIDLYIAQKHSKK